MLDNKTEQNVQDLESVIVPSNIAEDNGLFQFKITNLEEIQEYDQISVELEIPLHKIGDTLIINHLNFANKKEKDNYYDNLVLSKDFLGTITTIKSENTNDLIIPHEFYISLSVNKEDELIEFGLDNFIISALLLCVITLVIFFRKKLLKKK